MLNGCSVPAVCIRHTVASRSGRWTPREDAICFPTARTWALPPALLCAQSSSCAWGMAFCPVAQSCLLYISVSILHQFSTWNLLVLCCRVCYICLQKQVLSSFCKEGLPFVFISKMWCLPYLVRSFLCPTRCELSDDRR